MWSFESVISCPRKFSFDSIVGKTAVSDSKKHSGLDLLRWQGVLPCAYLAHWLLQGLGFAMFSFLRGPAYPEFLFPLLQYFPSGVAMVFVGATVAPSRKVPTSIGLTVLWMPSMWIIHVFGQASPGLTNYMHATGDSIGLLVGVALIFRQAGQPKVEVTADPPTVSDESPPS